ncbi:MAG: bifunctional demethylmenaquinone methyltransferase/2-methoxy-6-polyprenyl-1,4-benzoquinol methylase UbiE [Bdellovibrionaceae bacterium]|nr:bifunctional demethylmenaquinone methyltransferase/2-methoxy-6-polyprenyl-1,4-benzoquinol methylase UbiE [Pseudobdellovibrionaceae bacterium]
MTTHSVDPQKIKSMFSKVASGYDKANDILSAGIHHLWRKKLVKLSAAKSGDSVLDCATGTGDLAIEFKKAVGLHGQVIGTDFCKEMLDFAPAKAKKQDLNIKFELADVTALTYTSNSFDITSISFGIRNVADPAKGISELARVTKPGGKVCVLEFGQIANPALNKAYQFYSTKILPKIGGTITGETDAYEYLQNSSAQFPCRDEFVSLMNQAAPFSSIECVPVSFGIAYIYIGTKSRLE